MMTIEESRDKIRNEFPIGTKVNAILYDLRHKGIWEPQQVIVVGSTSEKDIKDGYRFGLHVEYEGHKYWVLPDDVTKV